MPGQSLGIQAPKLTEVACPMCPPLEDGNPTKHRFQVKHGDLPILVCPSVKSDAMRWREGWTVVLVGQAK